MTAAHTAAPHRADTRRPGTGRSRLLLACAGLLLACAGLLLALTGCASHSTSASGSASADGDQAAAQTVQSLGAVPIPIRPVGLTTPTASEDHLQLLAMGDAVHAHLPNAGAVVTALGPAEDPIPRPGKVPDHAVGTITETLTAATAPLTVTATDFSSHDENGTTIMLAPHGPASVTVTPATRRR
jgi:hypothetical protein